MQPHETSAGNNILAWVTVGAAATVGLFLLLTGLGLAFAVATTRQGVAQFVTAAALILSGGFILTMTRAISKRDIRGVAISAAAIISLTIYLVLTSNSNELVAINQLYLLLLLAFVYRDRARLMPASAYSQMSRSAKDRGDPVDPARGSFGSLAGRIVHREGYSRSRSLLSKTGGLVTVEGEPFPERRANHAIRGDLGEQRWRHGRT